MNLRSLAVWKCLVANLLVRLASDNEDAFFFPCFSPCGPVYVKIVLASLIRYDSCNVTLLQF